MRFIKLEWKRVERGKCLIIINHHWRYFNSFIRVVHLKKKKKDYLGMKGLSKNMVSKKWRNMGKFGCIVVSL